MPNLRHTYVVGIAEEIRDKVFTYISDKPVNLFLIGAATRAGKSSLRARLREELERLSGISVYYPEELFGDLIFGEKMDLLELENLLALSVDVIVVCPESAGSLVELGAFANHKELCRRLIVIGNKKHRHDQSFIRLGPLRYLIKKKYGRVLWHDYTSARTTLLAIRVQTVAKRIKGLVKTPKSLENPLFLEKFLAVAILVMQPISREDLVFLVKKILPSGVKVAPEVVGAAINHLIAKRTISLEGGVYVATSEALSFIQTSLSRHHWPPLRKTLDSLRVRYLNLINRSRYNLGGEAKDS